MKMVNKKKKWKGILGIVLSVSVISNTVTPVFAEDLLQRKENGIENIVESVTPEQPTFREKEKGKVLVGGIETVKELDLSNSENQVPVLEISESDVNSVLEEREKIQAGSNGKYGYHTLSASEKAVYNLLLKSVIAFELSNINAECIERKILRNYYAAGKVDVSSYKMTKSQMEKIYFALEADNLDFFWLEDTVAWEDSGIYIGKWYIMVEPDYVSAATRRATARTIEEGMKPFLEKIDNAKMAKMSEMELELLIHDMIIEEVDYAYNLLGQPETAAYAHSVVGVFDNNKKTDVVCEGYAKSFQYLCNYAGLESIYAVGYSTIDGYSGGHAWNLIKIDGKWYNVDVTWDDVNGSAYDGYIYDYYNLPTTEFNKDKEHDYRSDIFGGMYSVPKAVSTKANYYNYFGLNVTTLSLSSDTEFTKMMQKAIKTGDARQDQRLRFQCDSGETLKNLIAKVENEGLLFQVLDGVNDNGVFYKIEDVESYSTYNQLSVSVSKTYVENICDGYVFGEPKKNVSVYKWQNRQKKDITSVCNMFWEEEGDEGGMLIVEQNAQVLGSYKYYIVHPQIENIKEQEYTGAGICPFVVLTVNGESLQMHRDYVLEYKNNRKTGTGKIFIKGIGNYSGVLETSFQIIERKFQNVTISMEQKEYAYTGQAQKPEILVMDGEKRLREGVDYTLSFSNNFKMGTGKVTVTGKGNYQGSKSVEFYIVPQKVSGVKLKTGNGNSLKFTYNKQSEISGYEVSLYQGKKKIKVATTTKNSYQFKKLKKNTQYTFKVRAYVKLNGTLYGSYSNALTIKTATKAPDKIKVTSKNKAAVITWNKVSGATGYEVYMSKKKSSGFKKIATLSKASKVKCTKGKLSVGRNYYFKVRTYTLKNKSKVYSDFSKAKKVEIKGSHTPS